MVLAGPAPGPSPGVAGRMLREAGLGTGGARCSERPAWGQLHHRCRLPVTGLAIAGERSDSSHGCQGQSRAHLSADLSHASTCVWVYVQSLSLDPVDSSPPGSSVHGILQARTLEWVAMPSSRESSRSRDQTHISYVSCIWCHLGCPITALHCFIFRSHIMGFPRWC